MRKWLFTKVFFNLYKSTNDLRFAQLNAGASIPVRLSASETTFFAKHLM